MPLRENQTVLDVVTWVQRNADATLSYRFACRVGMCGSCAMTVNGRPRWTCRTHVSKVAAGGRLTIGPLENLPVIKDLATDMRAVLREMAAGARAVSRRRRPAPIRSSASRPTAPPAAPPMPRSNASIAASAMPPATPCAGIADYLGPAALNRAWTLVNDERDAGNTERLAAVAADGGCHACHSHQSCQEHCPLALNPTASIAGLKRRTRAGLSARRDQAMNVRLYRLAAATAALMAPLVLVHLAVIFYATRKGLSAADILARTRGSVAWAVFYGVFVAAVAVHASIGLRTVLTEWTPLGARTRDLVVVAFGLLLAVLGFRAVAAVVLP